MLTIRQGLPTFPSHYFRRIFHLIFSDPILVPLKSDGPSHRRKDQNTDLARHNGAHRS